MSIETTTESDRFGNWCEDVGLDDIYYRFDYARIWAREEGGTPVGLRWQGDEGTVVYLLLKVPLEPITEQADRIDVRTAYDFGGPYAVGESPGEALRAFDSDLEELFDEWGVVSEFARLHPLRLETIPEEAEFHADNFVVDLSSGYDKIDDAYKNSFARNVRQAERAELQVDIDDEPDDRAREAFRTLYLETMEKVDADPFYFFSAETLDELMSLPEMTTVNVWNDETIVASAVVLRSGDDLFYYLGASDNDYLDMRPNNILFDRIIRHGVDSECGRLHLGGGSPGLRRFKKQMATGTVEYHLLKRVHDQEAYEEICREVGVDPDDDAFPAYRSELLAELPD